MSNATKILVIVESPTKAKTIRKFLPKNFEVEASMGHVRDLPQTAADVPERLKKEPWARIGVNIENGFEPLYVVPKGKAKVIKHLKDKLKGASELYLATDEDREGESISWHLTELLKPKVPVKRMVFHEITKTAINHAIEECREIDKRLVAAQEARRILDRLVGFTLSPLIWKKIAYGLSAGRVQSAGLRMIVERERERRKFKKAEYWDLKADLEKAGKEFEARLIAIDGKRIATGKDFDEDTGKLKKDKEKELILVNEKQARELWEKVKSGQWTVLSVEEKPSTARPSPPFITSTLQQEANRKLGLSARDAMRVAQTLYEQGFITYMRTDSPSLSQQAIQGARDSVEKLYGKEYLSPEARQYSSKSKGAQEAHEAIRPAGDSFAHPSEAGLTGKEKALYDLIWKRTIATQMAEAKKISMIIRIEANGATFSASGMKIAFAGFLRAYVEGTDSPEDALGQREVQLPDLKEKDTLNLINVEPLSHETKPPARFTEASLVQRLEAEGIGRPSTYASVISTIIDRGYVRKVNNALYPTFTGVAVMQLLENHFESLVDYKFTSEMEGALDEIAAGKRETEPYLKGFYLGKEGLKEMVDQEEKNIDPKVSRKVDWTKFEGVDICVGRFGPYIIKETGKEDEEPIRASIPEDVAPADLTDAMVEEILEASANGPQSLGEDPKTGLKVYCLLGRYGPYVQLGEMVEGAEKPRRASVPKNLNYRELTLPEALKLLSLPRDLGNHPTTGKNILANNGRFGPYIVHDGDFRSLKKEDDVFTIDLKRALELLAEEKRSRRGAKLIREIGNHPESNKKIGLYDGKYGVYMKMASKNFTLPKDTDHEKLTLEQALVIIDGGAGGGGKKKAAKQAPDPQVTNIVGKKKKGSAAKKKAVDTEVKAVKPKPKKAAAR